MDRLVNPFHVTPVISRHPLFVLRDDMLAGGTKRRALNLLLAQTSHDTVAYAGTVMGHGALALAHACRDTGKTAHIFIATNDIDHPLLQKLQDTGALLHLEEPQPVSALYALAQTWQSANDSVLFPPGFATPEFEEALLKAVSGFDTAPYSEIWTSAVTGTLTRVLQRAFPHMPFKTVQAVKTNCDPGNAQIFCAAEKYHRPANLAPPYPSCPYTDAKIWAFAKDQAAPNALIWNTAG